MNARVVDASVAVKWLLPPSGEELVDVAIDVLSRHAKGEFEIVVPDLFWVECANVLWKAVRAERCSSINAQTSLARLMSYRFVTVSSSEFIERAFAIATWCDRTVYDSVYVAVASGHGIPLLTADQKLVNAVSARFPVKWLGSF